MIDKDKELLAEFHHTISEQLNSRLSESPKFFGLLIIVSTGYGYILSNAKLNDHKGIFILATVLSYVVVVWAAWYLAALGYAFRFLQNSQHLIERGLDWSPKFVPGKEDGRYTGEPPDPDEKFLNAFWLLPGIYHPHAAGFCLLLVMLCATFCSYSWTWWPHCLNIGLTLLAAVGGPLLVRTANLHYLRKFRRKRRAP